MAYRDDEDIICSDALTRAIEAENKKMNEVKWENMANQVLVVDAEGNRQWHEEVCKDCRHCSKGMHWYSKLRTSFGEPHGATFFLYDGLDMRLCKKHGFRTWERCWCPNYERRSLKTALLDTKTELLNTFLPIGNVSKDTGVCELFFRAVESLFWMTLFGIGAGWLVMKLASFVAGKLFG